MVASSRRSRTSSAAAPRGGGPGGHRYSSPCTPAAAPHEGDHLLIQVASPPPCLQPAVRSTSSPQPSRRPHTSPKFAIVSPRSSERPSTTRGGYPLPVAHSPRCLGSLPKALSATGASAGMAAEQILAGLHLRGCSTVTRRRESRGGLPGRREACRRR